MNFLNSLIHANREFTEISFNLETGKQLSNCFTSRCDVFSKSSLHLLSGLTSPVETWSGKQRAVLRLLSLGRCLDHSGDDVAVSALSIYPSLSDCIPEKRRISVLLNTFVPVKYDNGLI